MLKDRILIVDDDPSWQELLHETIEGLGAYDLRVARSYDEADALLDRQHFHLAFVDLRLREAERELEGKKIARKIFEQNEGTSIVIATGHADVGTAITALKEWRVLDFILKDAWDPGKVADLVQAGIPAARAAYGTRYESAIDFLRGEQSVLPWVAQVLAVVVPAPDVMRPDRRLGDFLNALLDGLYPLLPARVAPDVKLEPAAGLASAYCWSKALGSPVVIQFGRQAAVEAVAATLAQACPFTHVVRTLHDEALGVTGIVSVPAQPPFADFARA